MAPSVLPSDATTDLSRWRCLDEHGRQTWHYLTTDEQIAKWPQSTADKYFLGLDTKQPSLSTAKTPLAAARNGLTFFEQLQLPPGNWGCEYGGPMFLLPGLVITWYVTNTRIPDSHRIEITRYLFARQHPEDGGWGLHIEGHSSVFGTAMNYVVLRLLGNDAEDPRMVKARAQLHKMGGAVNGPHWAKFWLSVLGVTDWSIANPVPPELWLLPDWVPIAPWRWWIHMRMVFLPMSYIYSRRWQFPLTHLTRQLRDELFTQPVTSINFASHRNSIAPEDNYNPKSWLLNFVNTALAHVWQPWLRPNWIKNRAEAWTFKLIQDEDANTLFSDVGPVNAALNTIACYIHDGPDSASFQRHIDRLEDFLWVNKEGMLMNGTNGVQNWDTAFLIQAVIETGLVKEERWKPMLTKGLEYLEEAQNIDEIPDETKCYRHRRKGAWGFSTRDQGYTVSDTTSEALKAVMMLQKQPGFPSLVSQQRIRDSIDTILSMQNASGGVASYEPARGGEWLELLNAAEVFGRIMVEYDYPECTTACVTALVNFRNLVDPEYRKADIDRFIAGAVAYIRAAQRADGSWYGSWGICFTYATMFALESLKCVGETYDTSERAKRACHFLLSKQREDGGWGESYKSCEDGVYTEHAETQVVQTAWAVIGLLEAKYPERAPVEKAIRLIMKRQQKNGEWLQEGIEGVFNKSCMISYPNYKFIFPIRALGMFAKQFGDLELA